MFFSSATNIKAFLTFQLVLPLEPTLSYAARWPFFTKDWKHFGFFPQGTLGSSLIMLPAISLFLHKNRKQLRLSLLTNDERGIFLGVNITKGPRHLLQWGNILDGAKIFTHSKNSSKLKFHIFCQKEYVWIYRQGWWINKKPSSLGELQSCFTCYIFASYNNAIASSSGESKNQQEGREESSIKAKKYNQHWVSGRQESKLSKLWNISRCAINWGQEGPKVIKSENLP